MNFRGTISRSVFPVFLSTGEKLISGLSDDIVKEYLTVWIKSVLFFKKKMFGGQLCKVFILQHL